MKIISKTYLSVATVYLAMMAVAGNASTNGNKLKTTTIVIHAKRFAFVPSEITVHVGQPVRLTFVSDDVPHAISVEELHLELPITKKPSSVVITPETIAELTGMCSRYCGSGHDEMHLTIHVVQ